MTTLEAQELTVGYADIPVLESVSLAVSDQRITAIVGANASGKSTMLRTLARLLRPDRGAVLLDGRDIHQLPTREVALRLGILPQAATAPEGLTVFELVAQGRYPHQRWFRQWSDEDENAVNHALAATRTASLGDRPLDTLSGGQRQRVWVAMALAQDPQVLLLDEPTTYLDIANQLEILELLRDLNQRHERTIVMVLHDINQAARYAHHLVALHQGRIAATGVPEEILTAQLMRAVFSLDSHVMPDPVTGIPMCVPISPVSNHHDPGAQRAT